MDLSTPYLLFKYYKDNIKSNDDTLYLKSKRPRIKKR